MILEIGTPAPSHFVMRPEANVWWIGLSEDAVARTLGQDSGSSLRLPSEVLARAADRGAGGGAVLAKVELDLCGAWVTVANAGPVRPVLVRRAGWTDLRGHPSPLLSPGWAGHDDRIGLGPADMVLLRSAPDNATGDGPEDDSLFDLALDAAGSDPTQLVRTVCGGTTAHACLGVGVPGALGDHPAERVAAATGIPAAEVQSLGYPMGDLQPDLWSSPPPPPRLARLRLTRDRSGLATIRSLLDRLLASWRLDGLVEEADLKLIATELATNAVVHADFPDTITIRYLGDVIRVEVRDNSPRKPAPLAPSETRESGRGMHLVETLASSWGVVPLTAGKEVWCEVPVGRR